jgi:hypothetical protein
MKILVETLTDDFEEVKAWFEVVPTKTHGDFLVELLHAEMKTATGKTVEVTEHQLVSFGIFEELTQDAMEKVNSCLSFGEETLNDCADRYFEQARDEKIN